MSEGQELQVYETGWSPDEIFDKFRIFYEEEVSHKAITRLSFLEHLTYLLYLKVDHERSQQRSGLFAQAYQPVVEREHGWTTITGIAGVELRKQFTQILRELGKLPGRGAHAELSTTRAIFRDAQPWNEREMADLSKLINDQIADHHWSSRLNAVGHAYELLIEYCAGEIDQKRSTGQVVTPRPLLTAIARALGICAQDVVIDPAAGTGGCLLAAFQEMAASAVGPLPEDAYAGADRDPQMVRIATMNVLLNTRRPFHAPAPVLHLDSLERGGAVIPRPAGAREDRMVVICNPPFRSTTPIPEGRQDLPAKTPNFPANFLQHIAATLPLGGRAAVFVPVNVLTNPTSGAVLRSLMATCDVHTMLRLPPGTFRNGTTQSNIQANVVFFTKTGPRPDGSSATEELWIYDARGLASRGLSEEALDAFVTAYLPTELPAKRVASEDFGRYTYNFLEGRAFQLYDLYAVPEAEPEPLRPAREIAAEISEDLAEAQRVFSKLADQLP
ncbi:HsdM family class I SAM-dependent methyltransferase [Streptomyces hygroscopicus]|uniref:HsdM family class I SAM-dependent methyltransferase n=1 Tax=Streptomyces hygroscopicus TaxID=1912 RepID=UPI0004C74254|nr:N-6 DNA methylase [Streptomyces hygroscopicus]